MMDWTRGRLTTYEFYQVDFPSFREVEKLDMFTGGSIQEKALTSLKVDGSLECAGAFNIIADMVRVYMVAKDGNDVERVPLATLFPSRPKIIRRPTISTGTVNLLSVLTILQDDTFDDAVEIPVGTNIANWVRDVIAGYGIPVSFTASASTNNTPLVFDDEEDTKLSICNDLLDVINYRHLYVDGMGTVIIAPYISPSDKAPLYVFRKGEDSLMLPELSEDMDLGKVPNKLKLTLSNGDETMRSVAINDDPTSIVSTVARKRVVTATDVLQDIAGATPDARQANLDKRAREKLIIKSSVVQSIDFTHGYLPIPCDEVIRFETPELGVEDNFSITSRTIPLTPSANIQASVRRFLSL